MSNVPLFVWPVGPIINTEPIRYVVNKTDHDLVVDALREQNRVLDGALRLVLESWVNGRKVRDGIGQEVLVTMEAALTATSQPVSKKGDYSHHPAFDEYGEHR